MIGERVSHYQIEERIGSGGMGTVYLAEDTRLGRKVAVKFIHADRERSEAVVERFLREARTASSINHPHICTIHDIGEHDGSPFLVMELLEGVTLKDTLSGGSFKLNEAVEHAIQISEALEAAHAAGIIHRDVKPANVFINNEGRVKLLDFGLAKLTEADQDVTIDRSPNADLTAAGSVMGTVAYMSPEQARAEELDPRSDLFSLGVVLYEMVTGMQPFQGDSTAITFDHILNHAPKSIMDVNGRVPESLQSIIDKLLEKDPAFRYQAAAEVATDLRRIKRDTESGKVPAAPAQEARLFDDASGSSTGVLTAAANLGGLRLSGPIAILAVAVVILVAAILLFRGGDEDVVAPNVGPAPSLVEASIQEEKIDVLPLTTFDHEESWPAISPDGSRVAFVWPGEEGEQPDIYIKNLPASGSVSAGKLTQVTDTESVEFSPAWSPNGDRIAFVRRENGKFSIHEVATSFEGERLLHESKSQIGELDWSADGLRIAFSEHVSDLNVFRIKVLTLATQRIQGLGWVGEAGENSFNVVSARADHRYPRFSPDGQQIAVHIVVTPENGDVHVWSLDNSEFRSWNVTTDFSNIQGFDWSADGKWIIFSSNRKDTQQLWKADSQRESDPIRLAGANRGARFPSIASKTNRLVFSEFDTDADLWSVEVDLNAAGGDPAVMPASQVTNTDRADIMAGLSPDGKRIAFVSFRSGKRELWTANADGSNPSQLTFYGGRGRPWHPRWTADSKSILYAGPVGFRVEDIPLPEDDSIQGLTRPLDQTEWEDVLNVRSFTFQPNTRYGGQFLLSVSRNGGQVTRHTTESGGCLFPIASRQGPRIFFSAGAGNGRQIKVYDPTNDKAQVISDVGGMFPGGESYDGSTVYFSRRPGRWELWYCTIGQENREEDELDPRIQLGGVMHFQGIEGGILYAEPTTYIDNEPVTPLMLYDELTGEILPVGHVAGDMPYGFSTDSKGEKLIFTQFDRSQSDTMVVDNLQ